MKIEITLSEYWFPVLLGLFKALHWAPAIQWWRTVSKRHYSYKHAAKHAVADAAISIDLFWLANLIKEPKEAIIFWSKHFAHILKVQLVWALYVFAIPWQLAYLTVFAWILKLYIWLMDTLQGQDNADWGAPISDVIARCTPGGLWDAYCAYAYDEIEGAINTYKQGVSLDQVLAQCVAAGVLTIEPGGTAPTLQMTEAEKALCSAINEELRFIALK